MPEDATELVIVPADTYQRTRDVAVERRDTPLRNWLMQRHLNPFTAAAHFVSKYTVLYAALVALLALFSESTDISAILRALVLPPVLVMILLVRFVVPDVVGRQLR